MTTELRSYEMDNVMLDLGSDMNNLPKKSWELMGKLSLVYYPIHLWLENQHKIYHIGRLEQVEVNIEGVKTKVDFNVIEIMVILIHTPPYLALISPSTTILCST
jgi:hypothetical protein